MKLKNSIFIFATFSLALAGCADMRTAKVAAQSGDMATARTNYEELASRGFPEAQTELAVMLLEGKGGPADPQRGKELLDASAKNASPRALLERGKIYQEGEVVKKDLNVAEQSYNQALALGYRRAVYQLATLYEDKGDYAKAESYYMQALREDRNYKAAARIGTLYLKGQGHKADPVTALGWYYYAQSHQVEGVEKNINKLENKVGNAGIARAREIAQGIQ